MGEGRVGRREACPARSCPATDCPNYQLLAVLAGGAQPRGLAARHTAEKTKPTSKLPTTLEYGGALPRRHAPVELDWRRVCDARARSRSGRWSKGYRPNHLVLPDYLTNGHHEYKDKDQVLPGESDTADIWFLTPEHYPKSMSAGKVIRESLCRESSQPA